MEQVDFVPLNFLLKAPSREVVVRLCNDAFLCRNCRIPEPVIKSTADALTISPADAKKVVASLSKVIKNAVFHGSTDPKIIITLYPDDFHKNLRDLLSRIIIENIPSWKAKAINNLVSLPRLVDFDWRVDVKSASDSIARMSVPTCILQLQVKDEATNQKEIPDVSTYNVELSKEKLDTMLDGLGKIRDQLSSVSNR